MLATVEDCLPLLRCPKSGLPLVRCSDGFWRPTEAGDQPRYDDLGGVPVLVDFGSSILERSSLLATAAASPVDRHPHRGPARAIKHLLSPERAHTEKNIRALIDALGADGALRRVLVVGGGTVGQGAEALYDAPNLQIFAFDIYRTPHVQVIADAHSIPFADESFDAVVVQAVLEHVLEPDRVVAEIWRVLREDGLVYAETPFLQHVHEGAYDFTRFTESGHRYLFRRFSVLRSGPVGGPGVQFMWSVEYLVRGLLRSRNAGKVAKVAFAWTQYLDRLIPEEQKIDAASGVFLLGRKAREPIGPMEMVDYYQGAQKPGGVARPAARDSAA
jgi:SAM-dependent methyltransferase